MSVRLQWKTWAYARDKKSKEEEEEEEEEVEFFSNDVILFNRNI